jgi:hypothetical protein
LLESPLSLGCGSQPRALGQLSLQLLTKSLEIELSLRLPKAFGFEETLAAFAVGPLSHLQLWPQGSRAPLAGPHLSSEACVLERCFFPDQHACSTLSSHDKTHSSLQSKRRAGQDLAGLEMRSLKNPTAAPGLRPLSERRRLWSDLGQPSGPELTSCGALPPRQGFKLDQAPSEARYT